MTASVCIESDQPRGTLPPVVALGASAGGLQALEAFFTHTPPDSGTAFVVLTHLAPERKSLLPELLARCCTRMPISDAEDGTPLRPDHVYILPAGCLMTVEKGRLHLEQRPSGGRWTPIDHFLRSLARESGTHSAALILSGTGNDGAAGARAVKDVGGVVLVQDSASAAHGEMPAAARRSTDVDAVLPPERMAEFLLECLRGRLHEKGAVRRLHREIENRLGAVGEILRERTGYSLGNYKAPLQVRRIERRMALLRLRSMGDYLCLLRESPTEAQDLASSYFIGVTRFFRDTEAFRILESEVIPALLADRDPEQTLRIWVAGCSTGEEAYSIAILFREALAVLPREIPVQIFATDIDPEAIHQARTGFFPATIEADVSEERLRRFFTFEGGRYRVDKALREMIVFAVHNLLRDPPFSQLDLLSCRNLLIYLDASAQERLIPLFHHLLRPEGILFLGGAETIGTHKDLFTPLEKRWRFFRRREVARPSGRLGTFQLGRLGRYFGEVGAAPPPKKMDVGAAAEKYLVERYLPPSVLVTEQGEVLHFYAQTSRFLQQPVGASTLDLLKLARPELRPALRAALHQSFAQDRISEFRFIRLHTDEGEEYVDVRVEPMREPAALRGLALVVFERSAVSAVTPDVEPQDGCGELVRRLEEQLQIADDQLHTTLRDYERTNEALMSSNEELISLNEELQSTNEELETSKEELQALNEELVTVNDELESKVEELSRTTNDLENLLTSSQVATVFLDKEFRIQRFTPAVADLLELRPEDVGAPLDRIAGRLGDETLAAEARRVLLNLHVVEKEIGVGDGRFYLLRVLPYRTVADQIEGVVLTLVDVTGLKKAEEELARHRDLAEERARQAEEGEGILYALMENIPLGISIADAQDVTIRMVSKHGRWLTGRPKEAIEAIPAEEHPEQWGFCRLDGSVAEPHELPLIRAVREGAIVRDEEWLLQRPDGSRITVLCNAGPIRDRKGAITGGILAWQDITERKEKEVEGAILASILAASPDGAIGMTPEGIITHWNAGAERIYGYSETEAVGRSIAFLAPPELQHEELTLLGRVRAGEIVHQHETVRLRKDGRRVDISLSLAAVRDSEGELKAISKVSRDITERREAEEKIRASEQHLRNVLDSLYAFVGVMTPDGVLIEANRRALEAAGLRRKDVLGKPFDQTFWWSWSAEVQERIREVVKRGARGESSRFDVTICLGENRYTVIDFQLVPMFDAQGKVRYLVPSAIDIAERKKAEESLAKSEARFRQLADSMPQLVWSAGADGKVDYYNQRVENFSGFRQGADGSWDWEPVLHPEDLGPTLEAWANSVRTGGMYQVEQRVKLSDGSFRWYLSRAVPIRDDQGEVVRWFGTSTDIQEIKLAEERLVESESRFRGTFENAAVGIAHVGLDGRWLRVNEQLCRITGYPREELQSKTFMDITHPDDLSVDLDLAERLMRGEVPSYSMEKRYLRKDGSAAWIHLTGALQRDAAGKPQFFISVIEDISRRKAAEEALREKEEALMRAKEAAEAGSRAKSEFMANMSHEIRTPMTVIMAALEQLLVEKTDPQQERFLKMADEASRRLLNLIDDILDVARIEARRIELAQEVFELRPEIERAVELLALKAQTKGVDLKVEISPGLPQRILGDPGRLGQVVINLVGNAVKFTDRGEVRVTAEPVGDEVHISVRDTGIGIPSDKMPLLFRSFSQVDSSRTRRHGGTGLGLAVSKGLVELMGGAIGVESEEGRGSTFWFRLPLRSAAGGNPQGAPRRPGDSRVRILVAEDDPMVRDLLVMILERRDWEVTTAESGEEALALWEAGTFDLVLMDVQMPGMDGLAATRAIRAREAESGRRTPIIALTAHARGEDQQECMRQGADACLTKPVNMERLYSVIETHLQ